MTMFSHSHEIRQEIRPMLVLAGPVVMTEVGWMLMSVVDTMVVGRLGAEALGAVSIGSLVFFSVTVAGMGMLLGLDTVVSHAFGSDDLDECHRWLLQGIYLALVLAGPLFGVIHLGGILLQSWGINPDVLELALPYLHAVSWSVLPLLLYAALRRYLQAMGVVRPIMFVLLSANVINLFGNWVLVFGNLGAPALGVEGSGWATCISRIYLLLSLLGYGLYREARHRTGLLHVPKAPDLVRIRRLLRLGIPAAMQLALEVGVFALATTLAGRLDPSSLAAHQIALNVASLTFMVPLGIASAAAVRVGQALGRRERPAAARSGWTAILLGAGFMACSGILLVTLPAAIAGLFTPDPSVIAAGAGLLVIAACFQLFDGLQVVSTGALRGLGDTRTPMLTNLVGHWLIGLPIGYALCFVHGLGIAGLWAGLSIGLICIGIVLVSVWYRRARSLTQPVEPIRAAYALSDASR
jgi:MATE family multidrug resistance protein